MTDWVGTTTAAGPRPAGAPPGTGTGSAAQASIESRRSWIAASIVLVLLAFSYGSPLLAIVGLRPITEDLGTSRQLVALAGSLTWFGTGAGGILMGQVAERIGLRITVIFGAVMIAIGLAISASGNIWAILVGHTLFVGLLGNGAFYPPMLVYISRWFDRRRGSALALISSGQYVAGITWPILFEQAMSAYGWRATMLGFAAILLVALPIGAFFLQPPPEVPSAFVPATPGQRRRLLGMHPNLVMALLALAGFSCCIPMSIPQGHLVAFCTDIGIPAAQGAAMLSVMTGSALVARIGWGWISDKVGGLVTVLAGSACQAVVIAAFMTTRDEAALFAIAAAYGAGFSGLIPAYVVAIRELFPSREAAWRVPSVLFVSMGGMAVGGWYAGALYDQFGFYAPAFATGVVFSFVNMALIGFLILRQRAGGGFRPALA